MFTQEQAEKFANWIIAQENKMLAARYPISKEAEAMSDDELLAALGVWDEPEAKDTRHSRNWQSMVEPESLRCQTPGNTW